MASNDGVHDISLYILISYFICVGIVFALTFVFIYVFGTAFVFVFAAYLT